jgi:hypothetical protein
MDPNPITSIPGVSRWRFLQKRDGLPQTGPAADPKVFYDWLKSLSSDPGVRARIEETQAKAMGLSELERAQRVDFGHKEQFLQKG